MRTFLLGVLLVAATALSGSEATFAGGCFWCVEHLFKDVKGVIRVISGYTGGEEESPTYAQVSSGQTGHVEAVKLEFDPAVVSYRELLDLYWKNIDPTTANQQFCDVGSQYRAVIFYHDPEQELLAKESKEKINRLYPHRDNVVEILPAKTFWPAEEYHQEYYRKNPGKYRVYRLLCGRDRRLQELWGGGGGE